MKSLNRSIAVIALAMAAQLISGCPALMVGGLAYQGYKYEQDKQQAAADSQTKKPAAASQESISDSDIE
jgi:uncharacterized membrane protein YebE (DUF533 family)